MLSFGACSFRVGLQAHTGAPSTGLGGLEEERDSSSEVCEAGAHTGDTVIVGDLFCTFQGD